MRSAAVAGVAVLACVLAGCVGPSRIEPGICGNAVLEPGEACDTFTDPALGEGTACVSCRYVCDGPGRSCPAGWGCDLEEVCRFSSGHWMSAGLVDEEAALLAVGEVNGDGYPDLAGTSTNGTWVRFGEPDVRFTERLELPSNVFSRPAFGNLTGDALMDAALPVLGAFFVVAGSARGFDVMAQATIEPNPPFADGLAVFPIITDMNEPFDDVLAMLANGTISALALVSNSLGFEAAIDFGGGYYRPDEIRGLAIGDVDPGAESGEDVAITFAGEARVLIFHTGRRGGLRYLEAGAEIAIPEPVPDGLGVAFADVDRDGALDLLVPLMDGVAVAHGDGAGGFTAAGEDPRFAGLGWPLAIGDLDADGVLDYVFEDAIYLDRGGTLIPRGTGILSTMGHAAIADFNGDGVNDVAVAMSNIPRVQIILGSDSGYFTIGASFPLDTYANAVRTGDFDGDRIDDALFVEPSADGDTVSVIFGKSELFFEPPALMGRFETIASVEPALLAVVGFAFDITSDLLVLSSPTGTVGELLGIYIVFGTATRQMASGFNVGPNVLALFVGSFNPGGDSQADIVAVTEPVVAVPDFIGSTLQLIRGRGDGRFHDSDRTYVRSPAIESGMFDPTPACALWASGDVDGDGLTEVLGLARCGDPVLLVISLGEIDVEPIANETVLPLGDRTAPTSLSLEDVDGDGAPDAIVTWAEGLAVYWNDGGTFDATRETLLPAFDADTAWRGAATVNADADPAPELAIVSPAGVLIAEISGRSLTLGPGNVAGGGEGIWVGDVDRDHLDDLVVARGEQIEVLLAVPHDE